MKNLFSLIGACVVTATAALAQTLPAQTPAAKPLAAKPAPPGQVYRCGNQYVDRPCGETGGKVVQITANVVASGRRESGPDLNRKRPTECKSLEEQADTRRKQSRGKSSDQDTADLGAKIESLGC